MREGVCPVTCCEGALFCAVVRMPFCATAEGTTKFVSVKRAEATADNERNFIYVSGDEAQQEILEPCWRDTSMHRRAFIPLRSTRKDTARQLIWPAFLDAATQADAQRISPSAGGEVSHNVPSGSRAHPIFQMLMWWGWRVTCKIPDVVGDNSKAYFSISAVEDGPNERMGGQKKI